jgi:predicted phage tail protein
MWGNIATMVLGVILMVASYWVPPAGALGYGLITSAVVFNVGLALFATGIMGIISPPPRIGDYGIQEKPEERPSFIFDGPVNTINQGGPVPLVYGHVIVGSTLVSSSLEVTDTNV